MPALGAYVGGDIVAGMLASGMDRDKRLRLFIDVGTNCEIVLGDGERILADGGARGSGIRGRRDPMRHAGGRRRDRGRQDRRRRRRACRSSATCDAQGLCGSGLVDAVAELVRVGLLDASGRFIPDADAADKLPGLADRLGEINGERVFALTWREPGDFEDSVYISQRDVRELQFAKAAISTGWSLLLEEIGVGAG